MNLTTKRQSQQVAANVTKIDYKIDRLLEFNEFNTEHLLGEEIKELVFLIREVDSSLLNDETTPEFFGC